MKTKHQIALASAGAAVLALSMIAPSAQAGSLETGKFCVQAVNVKEPKFKSKGDLGNCDDFLKTVTPPTDPNPPVTTPPEQEENEDDVDESLKTMRETHSLLVYLEGEGMNSSTKTSVRVFDEAGKLLGEKNVVGDTVAARDFGINIATKDVQPRDYVKLDRRDWTVEIERNGLTKKVVLGPEHAGGRIGDAMLGKIKFISNEFRGVVFRQGEIVIGKAKQWHKYSEFGLKTPNSAVHDFYLAIDSQDQLIGDYTMKITNLKSGQAYDISGTKDFTSRGERVRIYDSSAKHDEQVPYRVEISMHGKTVFKEFASSSKSVYPRMLNGKLQWSYAGVAMDRYFKARWDTTDILPVV
ncbi:hypothetical protein ACFSWE_04070 [Leucobacter albus]|uniref:Uncharacterized protein n=1 Tax=Leucobacter albus TaxID=272210 RepID=A0ABW3TMP7_9MICO